MVTLPTPLYSFLILAGLIALLYVFIKINAPKKKHFYKGKIFGKRFTIGLPAPAEHILLVLFAMAGGIMDVTQNKIIDLGIDYQVILFGNVTVSALYLWQIFLIIMHVLLMGIFLLSLRSKATDRSIDILVGIFAFFGVAILLAGVIVQIFSPSIRFLFVTLRSIDFYHIGVYIEIFATLYWTFTK